MRLRNIPGAAEAVASSIFTTDSPEAFRGKWLDSVTDGRPVHIEIGCGKGAFLHEMARLHPDVFYIGCDRYASVLIKAVRKAEDDPLPNISFICTDAEDLTDFFEPGEIEKIYLNFSDPWPKARHAKRRLTSAQHLDIYRQLLLPGSFLEFKTDNTGLFDFSLEEIGQYPAFDVVAQTRDLHHDPSMNAGNVETEYEAKFSAQGHPICKLIARRMDVPDEDTNA